MIPIAVLLTAFVIAAAVLPPLIRVLGRKKAEQVISEDVPETHQVKKGTPTLGGLAILLGASAATILFSRGSDRLIALVVLFLATGALGFLDDYLILSRGRSAGQKWTQKLGAQAVLAAAFLSYLWLRGLAPTDVVIPGLARTITLGPALWILLGTVYLCFMSNAVNLSDGLDGLASGLCIAAAATCAAVGWYIHEPELVVFSLALAGACLGFLWFNCHPAQIFMGNTSSIALGMALGAIAVLSRQQLLLLAPFGVFLAEAFSVMIQVGYFKLTRERVFKKAPIHHHFEMLGWKETRVVARFCITAVVLGLLGLLLLFAQ